MNKFQKAGIELVVEIKAALEAGASVHCGHSGVLIKADPWHDLILVDGDYVVGLYWEDVFGVQFNVDTSQLYYV